MSRKPPVRHRVKPHLRETEDGTVPVRAHIRGKKAKPSKQLTATPSYLSPEASAEVKNGIEESYSDPRFPKEFSLDVSDGQVSILVRFVEPIMTFGGATPLEARWSDVQEYNEDFAEHMKKRPLLYNLLARLEKAPTMISIRNEESAYSQTRGLKGYDALTGDENVIMRQTQGPLGREIETFDKEDALKFADRLAKAGLEVKFRK